MCRLHPVSVVDITDGLPAVIAEGKNRGGVAAAVIIFNDKSYISKWIDGSWKMVGVLEQLKLDILKVAMLDDLEDLKK